MAIATRRAFILWACIALVWANLPYLIGYAASTPQNRFGGFFLYEQDGYSYLAKMRQGAQGEWLFHLPYTSEEEYQAGGIIYEFYLLLGKITPAGLDPQIVFQLARLASSILVLFVLARFIRRFVPNPRWQLWTWWLLLFSGGWGLGVSYFIDPRYVAYELIAPDASLFSILYGPPHVIFGFALLLSWIGYTLDTVSRRGELDRRRLLGRLLMANLLGGLTALSREAAYGLIYAGVFGAYLLSLTLRHKHIPWRAGWIVAGSAITAGVYSLYLVLAFRAIPGFAIWYAQNPFNSPSLIDFLLGYAPLLLLAGLGLYWLRPALLALIGPETKGPGLFIAAWLVMGPIMAYLPLPISRRLIAGWQIPLCLLGAYALQRGFEATRPYRRSLATLAGIACLPATFLVIAGGSALVAARQPPLFQPADELAALDWLSRNTSNRDVVLSDWRFGNVIPTVADARVFSGHPIETAFFKDKQAEVAHFFEPNTPDSDRAELVTRWHITLIVSGPDELIELNPTRFRRLFQQGGYSIYQLKSQVSTGWD